MSTRNHCNACDCTDLTDDDRHDGCCVPAPIIQDCRRPTLPVPTCPDEVVEVELDPETEQYKLIGQWLDQNCEPILDEDDEPITTISY